MTVEQTSNTRGTIRYLDIADTKCAMTWNEKKSFYNEQLLKGLKYTMSIVLSTDNLVKSHAAQCHFIRIINPVLQSSSNSIDELSHFNENCVIDNKPTNID